MPIALLITPTERSIMTTLDETLRQLVSEASAADPGSVARRRCWQEVYRLVTKSRKLWRDRRPDYEDGLQLMWEYCFLHLEEYDPERAGVITWLDYHLKRLLRNQRDRQYREQAKRASPSVNSDRPSADLTESIPERSPIDPVLEMWEQTLNWVQTDPDGVLQATRFRKREDINAQVLFLMRFPSETPWKTIAEQFSLNAAEEKDLPKFYNRNCLPLLREFGKSQGYL